MAISAQSFARPSRSASTRSLIDRFGAEMARSLREHSLLMLLVGLYAGIGWGLPRWLGISTDVAEDLYSGVFLVMTGVTVAALAGAYVCYRRIRVKSGRAAAGDQADPLGRFITLRRLCIVLPVYLLVPLFGGTFTNLKVMIPAIAPFHWDPLFAECERVLHGGHYPWEWLQPLLGHPYATSAINAIYHCWYFVTYGVLLWQMASTAQPRLRMRYLLTFLMIWALIGNAAAMALSSAGPVYFGRVTGGLDPFMPLMDYLRQANEVMPVPALKVQEFLWQVYLSKGLAIGGGISAMPSIHVAMAFSFVLLGFATNRRFGVAFAVFALFILVGSVHLGWHYAIDGYVAIIATWLIWRAVGWLLDRPVVARLLWGAAGPADAPARSSARP